MSEFQRLTPNRDRSLMRDLLCDLARQCPRVTRSRRTGPDESDLLREMAGYRNRLVHFYDEVSVEELYEMCTKGLDDIERLTQALVQWIRTHPERIDESL